MTNVTKFPVQPPVEPRIWVCICGCSTFSLRDDGTSACALCGLVEGADGGWTDKPGTTYSGDAEPIAVVQGNNSVDFARRVIAKRTAEEDTVAIVVVRHSGDIHVWTGAETSDQAAWIQRRITDAVELAKWAEDMQDG